MSPTQLINEPLTGSRVFCQLGISFRSWNVLRFKIEGISSSGN